MFTYIGCVPDDFEASGVMSSDAIIQEGEKEKEEDQRLPFEVGRQEEKKENEHDDTDE